MKKHYIFLGLALFVGFTGFAVWSMLARLREPKATKIIKPSAPASHFVFGEALYKRMRQEFRSNKVYILGVNGREDFMPLVAGWSKWYRADGGKQVNVFMPEDMLEESDTINTEIKFLSYTSFEETLDRIHLDKTDTKFFVITSPEVSQLYGRSNRPQKWEKEHKEMLLSFTFQSFAVNAEKIKELKPCKDNSYLKKDQFSNCAGHAFSHEYFYKEFSPEKRWLAVEQYGVKNFLIFYSN